MASGEGRDPGPGGAVLGVLWIVAAGIALGVLYNALGLASRPARGLPWVARPQTVQSLEALQPAGVAPAPADSARPVTRATAGDVPDRSARGSAAAPAGRAPLPAGSTPDRKEARARTVSPRPGTTASTDPTTPPPATAPPIVPDAEGPLKVDLPALKRLYDAGAVLMVDAREAEEYSAGHITGAVSLPYNDALADPERMKRLDAGGHAIAIYCSGGTCELSMDLAKLLVQSGRRKVLVYEGGFPEWEAAGHPVTRGTNPGDRP